MPISGGSRKIRRHVFPLPALRPALRLRTKRQVSQRPPQYVPRLPRSSHFRVPAHTRSNRRFPRDRTGNSVMKDTKLLYQYLRRRGGLAIPHTSGTRPWGPIGGTTIPRSSRSSKFTRGPATATKRLTPRGSTDATKSPIRPGRLPAGRPRVESVRQGVSAGHHLLERPRLDPYQLCPGLHRRTLERRTSTGFANGTPTVPPTTSCSTSRPTATSWGTSSRPPSGPASRSTRSAPKRSPRSRSSATTNTSSNPRRTPRRSQLITPTNTQKKGRRRCTTSGSANRRGARLVEPRLDHLHPVTADF